MFNSATNFNGNITSWDVSNVTNMSDMFELATNFNQNISSWDVSSVTNMANMFDGADSFNQPIGSWDVSNVTNMSTMLRTPSFNQNLGNWNISNVTNFGSFMTLTTSDMPAMSAANLDAIYNGWSLRPVQPNLTISFGDIQYTSAGQAGKNILTGAPNNWTILDGGI